MNVTTTLPPTSANTGDFHSDATRDASDDSNAPSVLLDSSTAATITKPHISGPSRAPIVSAHDWRPRRVHNVPATNASLIETATRLGASLPHELDNHITAFGSAPHRSGALLITDLPVGDLPATPAVPDAPAQKDTWTELITLAVALRLGQPVGYLPEQGGRLVQNIVPTEQDSTTQMSTSSRSNLMFHTETAFHPHRPHYLALLCLRGNADAHTTVASVFDILDHLPEAATRVMFEPRFRTAVDASFLGKRRNKLGPAHALITGSVDNPAFVYDADLTVGIDAEASQVVKEVSAAVAAVRTALVLQQGDLLLLNNHIAAHGRSPFAARFDGTDRWVQRALIVDDLAPSESDRMGRVITTQFGTQRIRTKIRRTSHA